jgi:cytochrome c5
MQSGEKFAYGFVAVAMIAMGVMIVSYELDMGEGDPKQQLTGLTGEKLQDVAPGRSLWIIPKGLTAADLPEPDSPGAKAVALYCAQCHDLPPPGMHNAVEWAQVLGRMRERMNERRGGVLVQLMIPEAKAWGEMGDYLAHYAQKNIDRTKYSDLDTPEGRAFEAVCSQCHGVPEPKQHTAAEWPRVVVRMKSYMASAQMNPPDDATVEQLTGFLREHAGAAAPSP